MTRVDDLWYLANQANQQAEQAYHGITESYSDFLERSRSRTVSRRRFRTLAQRVSNTGAPYGAHTIVYQRSGELLLVRHEGVEMWVLPGGEVQGGETYREAAERELDEEAGVEVNYDGLGMLTRIEIQCDGQSTWGILPIFTARAETTTPEVTDPDGEISAARWFDDLPTDTRDRADLESWRERVLLD